MVHKVEKQKILHLDLMKKDFGGIVNASRSLICAYKSEMWKDKFKEKEFAKATRAEASRMRDEINAQLKQ